MNASEAAALAAKKRQEAAAEKRVQLYKDVETIKAGPEWQRVLAAIQKAAEQGKDGTQLNVMDATRSVDGNVDALVLALGGEGYKAGFSDYTGEFFVSFKHIKPPQQGVSFMDALKALFK